jgi:hypothetical protein
LLSGNLPDASRLSSISSGNSSVLSRAIPWLESLPGRYFNSSRNPALTTPPLLNPSFSPSFAAYRLTSIEIKTRKLSICAGVMIFVGQREECYMGKSLCQSIASPVMI